MGSGASDSRRARGGFLLLDKPSGPTSHDMVRALRRLLAERRVGHCGTLDPLATGLLVLVVGQSTRLAPYATACAKRYRCTVELGLRTDSDDVDGAVIGRTDPGGVTDAALATALESLRRSVMQVPPRISALRVAGERSHRLARSGRPVELAPRPVEIRQLTALHRDGARVEIEALVSAGTYLRALARDLGELLGCGAAVSALRRIAVGDLSVVDAVPLEVLAAGDAWAHVRAPELLFAADRRLRLDRSAARELWRGATTASVADSPAGSPPWFAYTADDVVGVVAPAGAAGGIRLLRGFPARSET
ncbi:MAG: tRNA pseudouridine(55) synthase TruB [Deltaproteobacteria bacterium]|nr:tRNA pseudouridine(55) synthase TruB [Deltaproteobacteria bacterium]